MDFYSQQDKARRYTAILLLYFVLAIIIIVAAVNVVVYYFFIVFEYYPYTTDSGYAGLFYYLSAALTFLIAGGSLYRWFKLRRGGSAVAEMVGAELLELNTSELQERQLINVVEEMSIASGVPLPKIYIMRDEPGINAFVAGYQPTEAVIVVTQGALEQFSRAELQGVVAHEFSHILNGDMKINIRLIAVLAGIVMISTIGRALMRGSLRSRRTSNSSGGIVILGALLLVVGYLGVLSGRVIKAAVSRQREYLADAAAVQFTRNPQGIASALNTIRKYSHRSTLRNMHAEDMSHMCFCSALFQRFTGWLATHPPLLKRIGQIDPTYIARIKAQDLSENKAPKQAAATDSVSSPASPMMSGFSAPSGAVLAATAGQVEPAHFAYAAMVYHSFSEQLLDSVHTVENSRLVVYALILVKSSSDSADSVLQNELDQEAFLKLQSICQELKKLGDDSRLPLLDLVIPSLKKLNQEQKISFINSCKRLIKSDNRYSLHEFVLLNLLKKHLHENAEKNIKVKYFSLSKVAEEVQLLLSLMVYTTDYNRENAAAIFNEVSKGLYGGNYKLLDSSVIKTDGIGLALTKLSALNPLLKKTVIQAVADIAMHDGKLESIEVELVRLVAESLDCPLPPLIEQQ